MKKEYGLLSEMLKHSKPKQPSEKTLMKKAFDFTLEFDECSNCGMTWNKDDADNCENCEQKNNNKETTT